ncbi:hypothetical protein KKC63_00620 [Patescibacteria group bacterium]|nr:hypothetical protein [Patescibacteria group bacterium]MBU4023334.1 hypothetical protein [Patescibacteria group bacterium]MBU4078335.1 hypothetical protein [Patescibacteria group bacterium]
MPRFKFFLIVLLLSPILVFAGEVAGLYRLNISPTQAVINTGESIRISVDAWAYSDNVANTVVIDMGNGNNVAVTCQPGGHNCSGNSAPVTYNIPGNYTITATLCYLDSVSPLATICPTPITPGDPCCVSETTQVRVMGPMLCASDGCNGNCPAGCTVADDPDCGCLSGDGCCGIGCDNASDNDCVAGVSDYRNPLIWDDIITFIWVGIISIFSQSMVLVVLMILIGAYVIATSGGSITRVQLGKRIIIWTLIGYTIMLLARGIIMFIINTMAS